jgi:hypothetical protein
MLVPSEKQVRSDDPLRGKGIVRAGDAGVAKQSSDGCVSAETPTCPTLPTRLSAVRPPDDKWDRPPPRSGGMRARDLAHPTGPRCWRRWAGSWQRSHAVIETLRRLLPSSRKQGPLSVEGASRRVASYFWMRRRGRSARQKCCCCPAHPQPRSGAVGRTVAAIAAANGRGRARSTFLPDRAPRAERAGRRARTRPE